jgi:hypothetical protein
MRFHHSFAMFLPGGLYSLGVNSFHRDHVCVRHTAERIILAVNFRVERDVCLGSIRIYGVSQNNTRARAKLPRPLESDRPYRKTSAGWATDKPRHSGVAR